MADDPPNPPGAPPEQKSVPEISPGFAERLQSMLSSGWQSAKVSLLAQLPVIGPHGNAETEAELLLSGKKPMGWITVVPDNIDPFSPEYRRMIAMEAKLDEAVREGRLKAVNVVVKRTPPGGGAPMEYTTRHYCQPGLENDMARVAAYNQKVWNGEAPAMPLEKRFGDYLGYRQRDQMLFEGLQKYNPYLPRSLVNTIYGLNRHYIQPAYLEQQLGHPVEKMLQVAEAAQNGDATQQLRLGAQYQYGLEGAPKDPARAMEWYTLSAQQGLPAAQFELGRQYAVGDITPRNTVEAAKWLGRAADQGYPRAMTSLGLLYQEGNGIPQDDAKALDLFRRAAELGDKGAQAAIGQRYATGRGVTQDNVEAGFWYKLAAGNSADFPMGGEVLTRLTPEQMKGVDDRVAAWNAGHGSPKEQFKAQLKAGTATVEAPMAPVTDGVGVQPKPSQPQEDPFIRLAKERIALAADVALSPNARKLLVNHSDGFLARHDPISKLRLVAALDEISKTPEGKRLVDQFVASGASLKLDRSAGDTGGQFWPTYAVQPEGHLETLPVRINATGASGDGRLVAVLAHELQHLNQAQNRNLTPFSLGKIPSPEEVILHNRFIEADAQASATEIAYQLRQQGLPEAWDSLQTITDKREIAQAYEAAIKANPAAAESGHAKRAAFDTWFTAKTTTGGKLSSFYDHVGIEAWASDKLLEDLVKNGARPGSVTREEYKRLGQQTSGINYLDLPGTRPLDDPYYGEKTYSLTDAEKLARNNETYARLKDADARGERFVAAPDYEPPKSTGESPWNEKRPEPTKGTETFDSFIRGYARVRGYMRSVPENFRIAMDTPSALVTALPYVQQRRIDRALETLASLPEGKELVEAAKKNNIRFQLTPDPLARGGGLSSWNGVRNGEMTVALSDTIRLQGYSTEGTLVVQMAHELQHLKQANAGMRTPFQGQLRTPEDAIVYERFMEADAEATATELAYKLKRAGKPAAWDALQGALGMPPEISTAYEKMATQDPASLTDGRAKRAAFDAWFSAKQASGRTITNVYGDQALSNYPAKEQLVKMADAGAAVAPLTPEDVKKLGALSDVNYLDIPGSRPLNDPHYTRTDLNAGQQSHLYYLRDSFNRAANPPKGSVTLRHGTSEGYLYSILTDGFKPQYTGAQDKVRSVMEDVAGRGNVTDAQVNEVLKKNGSLNARAHEIGNMLYTTADADTARDYALRYTKQGGEFASKIYQTMGSDQTPRFQDARPVMLTLETPEGSLITRAGGASVADAYETLVKAGPNVKVKSVTFAIRDTNGGYTFDGQPALSPAEALAKINPQFAKAPPASTQDSERQRILKTINDLATSDGVTVTQKDAMYVAEAEISDAEGRKILVTIPDPAFVPQAEEKFTKYGFKGVAADYVLPHGLTATELNAYLATLDVREQQGKITAEQKTADVKTLLGDIEAANPKIKALLFDRDNPERVTEAVRGVINAYSPENLEHHFSGARIEGYDELKRATQSKSGIRADIDLAPEALRGIQAEMDVKNQAFARQEEERQAAARKVSAAEAELDAVLKRNAEMPQRPPFDPNQRNYWRISTGDMVTLEHGTSEGALYSILNDGFKPFSNDVAANTKAIVQDLLPGQTVTDDFVKKVMQGSHAGYRAGQSEDGRSLFALPGPNSDNATQYAINNASNGGEFANNIHQQVRDMVGGHLPPRYPGARPVILVFDAPRSDLGSKLPDKAGYAEWGSAVDYLGESEIAVKDTKNIRNVSAIFAVKDEKGAWTFEGQPLLSREEALAEIQPKFKSTGAAPRPVLVSEKAAGGNKNGPFASTEDLADFVRSSVRPRAGDVEVKTPPPSSHGFVAIVGDEVFKAPNSLFSREAFEREALAQELLKKKMTVMGHLVPEVTASDMTGNSPYFGMERKQGVITSNELVSGLPTQQQEQLAKDIAQFMLDTRKALTPDEVESLKLEPYNNPVTPETLSKSLSDPRVQAALGTELLEKARGIERDYAAFSKASPQEQVVMHGDLNSYNLLFDQKSGRLNGVIDYGLVGMGTVEREFMKLGDRPKPFLEMVAKHYEAGGGGRVDLDRVQTLRTATMLNSLPELVADESRQGYMRRVIGELHSFAGTEAVPRSTNVVAPEPEITTRAAQESDREGIAKLMRKLYFKGENLPADQEALVQRRIDQFLHAAPDSPDKLFIALDGGTPVALASVVRDEKRGGLLGDDLYTRPDYEKKGIATRLLTEFDNLAVQRGEAAVNLSVDITKPHLVDYYTKRGWTVQTFPAEGGGTTNVDPANKRVATHLMVKSFDGAVSPAEVAVSPKTGGYSSRLTPATGSDGSLYFPDAVVDQVVGAARKALENPPPSGNPDAAKPTFTLDDSKKLILAAMKDYNPDLGRKAQEIFDAGYDAAAERTKTPGFSVDWKKDLAVTDNPERWRIRNVPDGETAVVMRSIAAGTPQGRDPANPNRHAVIDFEFDKSMNSVVYMAHELGHAVADDWLQQGGKFKATANPAHMAETQAYFTQNILYDYIRKHPELNEKYPGITDAAESHFQKTLKANLDLVPVSLTAREAREALADGREMSMAELEKWPKTGWETSADAKKVAENIAVIKAGGDEAKVKAAQASLDAMTERLQSRPMGFLTAIALYNEVKERQPAERLKAAETILSKNGPQDAAQVLTAVGVHKENIGGFAKAGIQGTRGEASGPVTKVAIKTASIDAAQTGETRVTQTADRSVTPPAETGPVSRFMPEVKPIIMDGSAPANTKHIAGDTRSLGVGTTSAASVGFVFGAKGLYDSYQAGDNVGAGIATANLASSSLEVTEGLLTAAGKTLPVITKAGKFIPGANIALTAVDGVYQMSMEDTVAHKAERGAVVVAAAGTGVFAAPLAAAVVQTTLVTTGIGAAIGTGAVATAAVAAAPVVLTTAAVLGVVYVGGKIIESKRAWEETDAAIARNAKPEKRQGVTSEDGKPTIRAFKHIPITMLRTSVDVKDANLNGKLVRNKEGQIPIGEILKLDMHDPKNIAEFERVLALHIKKQEDLMKANETYLPKWLDPREKVSKHTLAQMELADLTAARTELDMYKNELKAWDAAHSNNLATTQQNARKVTPASKPKV
ncbi:MAG: GNAT family N-acetyltransferase [Alphaproteobacteria bacterium]